MKGDDDEGRLWSPLEAWRRGLGVLERERRDERTDGGSEKKEYLMSERKNGAGS